MATIAIGQRLGSGGAELGALIARRLEARFLGLDELLREAATRYQVDPEQLRVFDTREQHFWDWLTTNTGHLVGYFQAVILKRLTEDNVVLVSGTVPLFVPKGAGHVLRVRTIASLASRVQRLMEEEGLTGEQAERRARESDREVQARVRSMLQVDVEDPQLYDVVLNTTSAPIDTMAGAVIDLARAFAKSRSSNSRVLLNDACVTSQVRAALMAHPKIRLAPIEVTSSRGSVTLTGESLVPPWDRLVRDVVAQVDGVASVKLETHEPPIPPRAG